MTILTATRYDARDAFRIGIYGMLGYTGSNLALEFLYRGPHSVLTRILLPNRHEASEAGSKP